MGARVSVLLAVLALNGCGATASPKAQPEASPTEATSEGTLTARAPAASVVLAQLTGLT
jgi:hypothetical protein